MANQLKPRLSKWFSQPTSSALSTSELVEQLEQRLTEANAEVSGAETRNQELLAKFAENRTPESLEAQEAAEADVARLQKLRGLVVADLEAAKTKLAEEKRVELERRKAELTVSISDHSEEIRLAKAMAHTFIPVIDALLARVAHAQDVRNMKAQLHSVRLSLGEPSEIRFDHFDSTLSHYVVVEELKRLAQGDPSRSALLYKFSQLLEGWR